MEDNVMIYIAFSFSILALVFAFSSMYETAHTENEYELRTLSSNSVGVQGCTKWVKATSLYCKDKTKMAIMGLGKTNESNTDIIEEFMNDCNDIVVTDSSYCDGDRITFRNKNGRLGVEYENKTLR